MIKLYDYTIEELHKEIREKLSYLSHIFPYEILYVNDYYDGIAIIRFRTGLIDVVPLTKAGAELLLSYGGCGVSFWVVDLGGEDWVIVLYREDEKTIEIYKVDNWELILEGLKKYKPKETIEVGRHD